MSGLRHQHLVLLLFAALLLAGCAGPEQAETAPDSEGEVVDAVVTEPSDPAAPLPRSTVEIYFPSARSNGLVGEFHQIFETVNASDKAKQIIADLIAGPAGKGILRALPPATRLRQAYVLGNGVAYVDFSADLKEGIGGGSMEEILAVYAIVNSIVVNIPEVRRVGILVNGRELSTLNGHLDLRRPLPANYSLIIGSIMASAGE